MKLCDVISRNSSTFPNDVVRLFHRVLIKVGARIKNESFYIYGAKQG